MIRLAAALLLLNLLAVASLMAPGVRAQAAPGTDDVAAGEVPPPGLAGIEAAELGVLKLWFERHRLLAEGDAAGAGIAVERMAALMDREGIRGMEVLAGAFAHEGYTHLRSGNYLSARESFNEALRFDPSLPAAYFGLARARRLTGEGTVAFFGEWGRGLRAAADNFWFAYTRLANLLFLLLATLAVFTLLFAVLVTARHQSRWRHEVAEYLHGRGVPEGGARVLALVVFLAPLLLWLSGVWLLLYWLAGTFRYMTRAEKIVALAGVVGIIAAVPATEMTLSIFRVTDSATVKATVSALKGGYEPEKVAYIEQILENRPDDPTIRFLLAAVLKDGGKNNEAFQEYKRVIELAPENYRAYNNIGNIYFIHGQFGEAVNWYRRATDLKPDYAIAHFNANLAQKEQLHFTEADASLDRARGLDPKAVAGFLERTGEAASAPVDDKIPMREAWREVVYGGEGGSRLPPSSGWLHPVSLGGAVALLAMLLVGLPLSRRPAAQNCSRCGRAYCGRCSDANGPALCGQCTQMMLRKDDVAPELRQRKQRQVARWEWWSGMLPRVSSFLLPGAGRVLSGRTLRGCVLALLWIGLWLHLLLAGHLLEYTATPYSPPAGFPWAAAAGLALIWLTANLSGSGRLTRAEA
jgi:tetratricopeptide (TPR) repeat protein